MVSHVGKGLWSKVCLNCTGTYGRLAYEIPDIMYTLDLLVSSRQQYTYTNVSTAVLSTALIYRKV